MEPLTAGDTVTLTVGSAELDEDILSHLKAGNKIQAIKARRMHTNEGLKEAKEYVDSFERNALETGKLTRPVALPPRW